MKGRYGPSPFIGWPCYQRIELGGFLRGVLGVLLGWAHLEAATTGWAVVASFIFVALHSLGCKGPCPWTHFWKRCGWSLSRARSKASAQGFCSMVEGARRSIRLDSVHHSTVWVPHGCEPRGWMQGNLSLSRRARREGKQQEGELLCPGAYILHLPEFAVATPHWPDSFPGVTDRRASSHVTQALLGMSLLPSTFPQWSVGNRRGEC